MHAGNVFLGLNEADQLVSIIGDFGKSRLEPPLEEPFNSTEFLAGFTESERPNYSSEGYTLTMDPEHRLPFDCATSLADLNDAMGLRRTPRNQPLFAALDGLSAVLRQE